MTEERIDQLSRDLAALAARLPSTPAPYDELRSLLNSLPAPTQPELLPGRSGVSPDLALPGFGSASSPLAGNPPGQESGAMIGVIADLFFGQANLLLDPTIVQLSSPALTGSIQSAGAFWNAHMVTNSGTPGVVTFGQSFNRFSADDDPYNSTVSRLFCFATTNTYDIDVYLYPKTPFSPNTGIPNAAYLIAAARVMNFSAQSNHRCTAYLELVDLTTATVVARSTGIALEELGSTVSARLWASWPETAALYTDDFQWRLRFNVVKTTSASQTCAVLFGEPQLAQSTTAIPGPYAPIVGKWVPDALTTYSGGGSIPIFEISGNSIKWGGGSAVADAILSRAAAGDIRLTTPATVPAVFRVMAPATSGSATLQATGNATGDAVVQAFGGGSGKRAQFQAFESGDTFARVQLSGDATFTGLELGPGNAGLTQVLTTRRTGWTAPTGTAQRGTFATDTVTLINLARAVKALIDDLMTHGLIG